MTIMIILLVVLAISLIFNVKATQRQKALIRELKSMKVIEDHLKYEIHLKKQALEEIEAKMSKVIQEQKNQRSN